MKKFYTLAMMIVAPFILHAQKFEWMRNSPTSWNNSNTIFTKTDAMGNVFVSGSFSGHLVNGNDTIWSYQSQMCSFLSKYDANGNHLWSKPFGPTNGTPQDICIDSGGNLFMSLVLNNFFTYIDDDTTFNFVGGSYCLVSFDNNGTFRWGKVHPTQSSIMAVTASFQHPGFYSASGNALYRFNTDGNIMWSRTTSGALGPSFLFRGVQCNDTGTLIVCGIMSGTAGTVTLDTVSVTMSTSWADMAFFRLDSAGNAYWGRTFPNVVTGATYYLVHKFLVTPTSEFYYLYIKPYGPIDYVWDSDTIFNPYCPVCEYNAVVKFNANGNVLWARNGFLGDGGLSGIYDFTMNNSGDVYIIGTTVSANNYFGNSYYNNFYGLAAYHTLLVGKINSQGTYGWLKSDYRLRGQLVYNHVTGISGGLNSTVNIVGRRALGLAPSFNLGCLSDSSSTSGTIYFLASISENTEPVPVVDFDVQVDGLSVYMENRTTDGGSYYWTFGDGQSTSLTNPSHTYSTVGSYNVCLSSENSCGQSQQCRNAVIEGLGKVTPGRMANSGYHKLQIKGGFASDPTLLKFVKSGSPDILPDTLRRTNTGLLEVNIKLLQADPGNYDLVYQSPTLNDTLVNAITLEASDSLQPYVTVTGPGAIRPNVWAQIRVTVTNPSNVSYYGIPVYVTLTPNVQTFLPNMAYIDSATSAFVPQIGSQFAMVYNSDTTDSSLFTALLMAEIQPFESRTITLFIKAPVSQANVIRAYVGGSYFSAADLNAMGLRVSSACNFLPKCLDCVLDMLGFVPTVGCVTGALNLGCSIGGRPFKGASNSDYLFNILMSASSMTLTCVTGGLSPKSIFDKISNSLAAGLLVDFANGVTSTAGTCTGSDGCDPFNSDDWIMFTNNSVDPNYKSGPQGGGAANFINKNDILEYTIHFENLDTATAPAAEVVVVDTLDMNALDLSTFSFTGFGQTDSTINFNVPSKDFVTEIDLQPAKNAILRVAGSLDTLTGVVRCSYRSLDPITTEIAPLLNDGFLNPNVSPPEGEGFVSFKVKPKNNITHLQQINNTATIYFDNNAPLATNIQLNTIDTVSPSSNMLPLPANSIDTVFTLKWTGFDADAGISNYDIYMSENDSPYVKLVALTTKDSILFTGANGNKYEFYSIARDHARNIEQPPPNPDQNPDAVTTIVVGLEEFADQPQVQLFPNPVSDLLHMSLIINTQENITLLLNDSFGRVLIHKTYGLCTSGLFADQIDIRSLASGSYVLKIIYGENFISKKVFVMN